MFFFAQDNNHAMGVMKLDNITNIRLLFGGYYPGTIRPDVTISRRVGALSAVSKRVPFSLRRRNDSAERDRSTVAQPADPR
jgi:hypothetical protein